MGLQSSRIIWGKDKLPGDNEITAVELYNENYIYVSGNYAIRNDGHGTVAENYHLYLCTAEETGGQFNAEDWKIQNGVKNWYLISGSKIFKKGARTLKEDIRGDYTTLKLYKCIVEKSSPAPQKGWVPEEWEVVYQNIGIGFIPRDHKDVYYDDGKNKMKWHRLMYFVPDYMSDEKEDLEITPFEEGREYHTNDMVLHWSIGDERYYCYKYINDIPRSGEWDWRYWELQQHVDPYETYRAYHVGDRVIRKHVHSGHQEILPYDEEMYYDTGSYCIHEIDRERDIAQLSNFSNVDYLIKLYKGETLYGLYKCTSPSSGEFGNEWILQASEQVSFGIYSDAYWDPEDLDWKHGGERHPVFGLNPNEHDILTFGIGPYNYDEGDLVIWTSNDGDPTPRVYRCINYLNYDVTRPYTEYEPRDDNYYWEGETIQLMQFAETYCIYECIHAMTADQNTHFIDENWKVITQKVEPNHGLYGVIWEKLPVGQGGGIPYYFPMASTGKKVANGKQEFRINNFFGNQFNGVEDSKLNVGPLLVEDRATDNYLVSLMKVKSNSKIFFAYASSLGGGNNNVTKIYISSNGMDWHAIELDHPMNTEQEISPTEDGFLYLNEYVVYKVVIKNLEKYSETVLVDTTNMVRLSNPSLVQGCVAFISLNIDDGLIYWNRYFSNGEIALIHLDYHHINDDDYVATIPYFNGHKTFMVYFKYLNSKTTVNVHFIVFDDTGATSDTLVYTEYREGSSFNVPITRPYYYDDQYAYFGFPGKIWRMSLSTGAFELYSTDPNLDGIIDDIPYYNNQSCQAGIFTINKLKLYAADVTFPQSQDTVHDNELTAYFYFNDYFSLGHGGSFNGRPIRNTDLLISQPVEIRGNNVSAGVYNLCVYLQDYDGVHFDNRTSFFWLSKITGTGAGPFYGGPDDEGF